MKDYELCHNSEDCVTGACVKTSREGAVVTLGYARVGASHALACFILSDQALTTAHGAGALGGETKYCRPVDGFKLDFPCWYETDCRLHPAHSSIPCPSFHITGITHGMMSTRTAALMA